MAEAPDPQLASMFSIDQFTTTRLDAQRMALEHFPEIHRLHTDPLVMKTLSADGNVMSDEATRKHLQRCSDRQDEIRAAFADGWTVESIKPSHFEPNPESEETYADGGPRAWFVVIRRGS